MKNSTYWANRMRLLEKALLDDGYEYVQNLEKQYDEAIKVIEQRLAVWYQRFAANNEISLAEAKRMLTTSELKEFKWTVADYIARGEENAIDGIWAKQLENASARVHISRLDSLKMQIQQEAEALYGKQLAGTESVLSRIYENGYYHTAFEIQVGTGLGWSLQSLNPTMVEKVLSRPWTIDGQTFRDRCWTNKQALVNSVNTQITQMIMRGEAPDKAIKAISQQFNVAKNKAGRLVMTESAAFSSAAQKDCFTALDVEQYRIVGTLDEETCGLCADLDGKVYKMSDFSVGSTAPPFHPWCRCTTCPHFDDMESDRFARDVDGKRYSVPADMNYRTWESYNAAVSHETTITATIRDMANTVGCELSGLEYRLKTPESYTRKVNTEAANYRSAHPGATYKEAYAYANSHMYDTVRYTSLSVSNEFYSNFNKAIYNLKKKGYNINRVKNSLPNIDASYRGVNTVVATPDGYNFELQFHTPESLSIKNKTHTLYEEQRKSSTSAARKAELGKQMQELTRSLATPKDAELIMPFDYLKGR